MFSSFELLKLFTSVFPLSTVVLCFINDGFHKNYYFDYLYDRVIAHNE